MAKKTKPAAVVAPGTAVPADLAALISAASEAAATVTRTSAEATAKPEDADAVAAAASAATLFAAAIEAIEQWFGDFIAARLAGADAEAERQLEERRATLKTLLEEHDAKAQALTARRAEVEAALEALKNTAATEENGGDGDAAIPANLPLELEDGCELITVIGPPAGLRRAGHLFNAVPNTVVVSAEQKALIAADPALSITDNLPPAADLAAKLYGERPAADAFVFDPNGFTDVKVLGPKAGRRRIGHHFGPQESIVRVDARDLEELLGDDQLAVGQA